MPCRLSAHLQHHRTINLITSTPGTIPYKQTPSAHLSVPGTILLARTDGQDLTVETMVRGCFTNSLVENIDAMATEIVGPEGGQEGASEAGGQMVQSGCNG